MPCRCGWSLSWDPTRLQSSQLCWHRGHGIEGDGRPQGFCCPQCQASPSGGEARWGQRQRSGVTMIPARCMQNRAVLTPVAAFLLCACCLSASAFAGIIRTIACRCEDESASVELPYAPFHACSVSATYYPCGVVVVVATLQNICSVPLAVLPP